MGPFDFVKSINYQKQDLLQGDVDGCVERDYIPFIVNRALSNTVDTVLFANETNMRPFLDKKLQYHYLLNTILRKNRYGAWLKSDVSEKVDLIMRYFKFSLDKAKSVEAIFSDEDVSVIKLKLSTGGLKDDE